MEKELQGDIGIRHTWKSQYYDFSTPISQIECTCFNTPGAKLILPLLEEDRLPNVMVWNNCARTLFACVKRQCMEVPLPEPKAIGEFITYAREIINEELGPHLSDFDYSYSQWYNHLSYKNQIKMDFEYDHEQAAKASTYGFFCKREVQLTESQLWSIELQDVELPKSRAIAGPSDQDKYIMGPVTWALESVFTENLFGYCGNKNWEELEAQLCEYAKEGYLFTIQGDGSGWDRTQSHELKEIDRIIYELIKQTIHHVDPEDFIMKSTTEYRKLQGNIFSNGLMKLITAYVSATTFSGSTDTTLMNTTRLALVIRYIMHKAGIDDYKLFVKGDDFLILTKSDYRSIVEPFFWELFSRKGANLNKPYGLGLILKFLTFGDLEDIDFCSTNVIYNPTTGRVKIVRQLPRIKQLTPWSRKALAYSNQELKHYIREQGIAMKSWAHDMPFYGQYADYLIWYAGDDVKDINITGKARRTKPWDGHKLRTMRDITHTKYGRDHDYGVLLRTSKNTIDQESVYRFIWEKYKMSKNDIESYFERLRAIGRFGSPLSIV